MSYLKNSGLTWTSYVIRFCVIAVTIILKETGNLDYLAKWNVFEHFFVKQFVFIATWISKCFLLLYKYWIIFENSGSKYTGYVIYFCVTGASTMLNEIENFDYSGSCNIFEFFLNNLHFLELIEY